MIKITRRSFLKSTAATGAAIAISGPVLNTLRPSKAEAATGEAVAAEWKATTCAGCTTWCAVEVKTQTDPATGIKRAVDIRGHKDTRRGNATDGDFSIACPRARIALQEAYDPDRVTVPMMRTNPEKGRGIDPGFVPLSMDDAMAEIAWRMVDMRNAGNSHKWAWLRGRYSYCRTTTYDGIKKVYGSPNGISHSAICAEAENFARSLCIGRWGYDDYDIDNCKYLVLWGVDPLSSNRMVSGAIHKLGKRMNTGEITVVSVDPRLNAAGAKAHKWLAPKPGTDGALALAMAAHIVKNNLYNTSFVGLAGSTFAYGADAVIVGTENVTYGLETWWNKVLKNCDPDSANFAGTGQSVYTITGIRASAIKEVAEGFAAAGSAACSWIGPGIAMQPNGVYGAWAAIALNGLVGSFNAPGGELVSEPSNSYYTDEIPSTSGFVDTIATTGGAQRKLIQYTTSGVSLDLPALTYTGTTASKAYKLQGTSPTSRLAKCINDGMPYETKMLISAMGNFAFSCTGALEFEKAYGTGTATNSGNMSNWSATADDNAPPFIVDITTHASETSMFSDIIIPAKHLGLEAMGSTHGRASGRYKVHSLYQEVITPLWADAISPETEFAYLLAEAMDAEGFSDLLNFYKSYATLTGSSVTDAASFALAANIWHGTKKGDSATNRQAQWTQMTTQPYVDEFYTGVGAGNGITQATKTNYAELSAAAPTVFYTGPLAGGAAAGEGRVQFYNPMLKAVLEKHRNDYNTLHGTTETIGSILTACNYDRIGGLAVTDVDQAYVPNWEDPYISGGSDPDFPYTFIDHKSRFNREGRSANTSWYHQFKSNDPGDECWKDVIKINPLDAKDISGGLKDGDTVTVYSPTCSTGVVCKVKIWAGVRAGTVAKAYGQGHWAYGRFASKVFGKTANGGNNNELLPEGWERLSGATARNGCTRVKIVKLV